MNTNLRVDVAKVMISAIESRMQGGMNPQVIEELKKILEAWERVRDAALASQREPDDFVHGEPGVAPCQCRACVAARITGLYKKAEAEGLVRHSQWSFENEAIKEKVDATLADEIAGAKKP
jgi:hypothetical protein